MGQPSSSLVPPTATPRQPAVALPASVEGYTRTSEARRIDSDTIFEYMDGAGELYLAYRFDHLALFEYHATPGDDILVELYFMQGPDDAFGLLSGDWGGEEVDLAASSQAEASAAGSAWPHALYGGGLLRVAADNVYARVMAMRESEASRRAVLAIGRAVVAGRAQLAEPRLVAAVPGRIEGFAARRDSVCFLRSHLVLNSAYFLSQQNILSLGRDVDAVTLRYDPGEGSTARGRVRVVLVRYRDPQQARQALADFRQAYLPETQRGQGIGEPTVVRIEDGWAACQVRDRALALALECPDEQVAHGFVTAGLAAVTTTENDHE